MLPLGLQAKIGYVPRLSQTTQLSAKESAANPASEATGRNLTQLNLSMSPLDGLSISGDVAQTSNETGVAVSVEEGVSANIKASYTNGPVSIGYVEGGYQPAVASGEVTYYENKFYGISFDVNDAISVSYNVDQSDKNVRTAVADAASAGTKTVTDMEQKSVQLAYTTGGATIGIAQVEVSNSDYTSGKDEAQTVVSLGISF